MSSWLKYSWLNIQVVAKSKETNAQVGCSTQGMIRPQQGLTLTITSLLLLFYRSLLVYVSLSLCSPGVRAGLRTSPVCHCAPRLASRDAAPAAPRTRLISRAIEPRWCGEGVDVGPSLPGVALRSTGVECRGTPCSAPSQHSRALNLRALASGPNSGHKVSTLLTMPDHASSCGC